MASGTVPSIPAPLDLAPKTTQVKLRVTSGTALAGGRVVIDPGQKITEITRRNNELTIPR
jgi:hypothetical protein